MSGRSRKPLAGLHDKRSWFLACKSWPLYLLFYGDQVCLELWKSCKCRINQFWKNIQVCLFLKSENLEKRHVSWLYQFTAMHCNVGRGQKATRNKILTLERFVLQSSRGQSSLFKLRCYFRPKFPAFNPSSFDLNNLKNRSVIYIFSK